jgi:hypothetical protein
MPYGGEWRGRVDKVEEGKEKTEKGKKEIIGISHVSRPREAVLPNQTTQTVSDSQMNLP